MKLLLEFFLLLIGGLIAINVRYYISIHNASFTSKEKKVYFISGNAFVIIITVFFVILNAKK